MDQEIISSLEQFVEPDQPTDEIEQDESGEAEQEQSDGQDENSEDQQDVQEAEHEQSVELNTLDELASHLGVDVADLYKVHVPITGPDGESRTVSLGQWKDEVQHQLKSEMENFNKQKAVVESQLAQHHTVLQQNLQFADTVVQQAEKAALEEYQSIDWNKVKAHDPAAYAALKQDYNERWNQLQYQKHQIAQQVQQHQQILAHQQIEQYKQRVEDENRRLVSVLPEWKNEAVARAEKADLKNYLINQGFAPEETDTIADHRFVVLARKAMLHDKTIKAQPQQKRVVKIGGKPLVPGKSEGVAAIKQRATNQQKDQLKRTGSLKDAASIFEQLI